MSSDVTCILTAIEQGDPAADQLLPLVYPQVIGGETFEGKIRPGNPADRAGP